MPIFEYECPKCGKTEERLIMGRYKPPKCCGKTMQKVISASVLQFKGSGFYATEYGSQYHNLDDRGKALRKVREQRQEGKIPIAKSIKRGGE
jgi:putative FmdB family regulatory protein